jgi:hypothetical protein
MILNGCIFTASINNKIIHMKLLSSLLLVVAINSILAFSCSKNDNSGTAGNINTTGNWRVTLFWDKKDETAKFTGYTFIFSSGGQVTANIGATTVTGSWSESDTRLQISFGTDPLLSSLNKNWLKESISTTLMSLKDDNPASDERVQFSK